VVAKFSHVFYLNNSTISHLASQVNGLVACTKVISKHSKTHQSQLHSQASTQLFVTCSTEKQGEPGILSNESMM